MRPATSHRADFISPVFRAAERQGAVLALQVRCAHPPGRGELNESTETSGLSGSVKPR